MKRRINNKGSKVNNVRLDVDQLVNRIQKTPLAASLYEISGQYGVRVVEDSSGNLFKRHNSFKYNYYNTVKPVLTDWSSEIRWNEYWNDALDWCEQNLRAELYKDMKDYHDNVMGFHLSYYFTSPYVQNFYNYGFNHGTWDTAATKEMNDQLKIVGATFPWMKFTNNDFKWESQYAHSRAEIKASKGEWKNWYDDILLRYPYLTVLNTSSTTGYPFYTKQRPDVILENLQDGFTKEYMDISMYRRMQGAKRSIMDDHYKISYKIRDVFGGPFSAKIKGAPLTYSWRNGDWIDAQLKCKVSPYYRDANEVFDEILTKYKDLQSGQVIFTSDQTGFDTNHDARVIKLVKDSYASRVPRAYRKWWTYINRISGSPGVNYWFTGIHRVKRKEWLRVSGSSDVPMEETLLNTAIHKVGWPSLSWYSVQIDDFVGVVDSTDIYKDLEVWAEDTKHKYGFIINPAKTESSERGYVVFLQMILGDLRGDGEIWRLGHLMRRLHRLRYRERRSNVEGELYIDEELADINVTRFIDTIGSLGNQCPDDLLRIIITPFFKTKIWSEVREALRVELSKWVWVGKEYGEDNRWLPKRLQDAEWVKI